MSVVLSRTLPAGKAAAVLPLLRLLALGRHVRGSLADPLRLTAKVAKRLGLGSVLGYLLAGILIGPVIGLVGVDTLQDPGAPAMADEALRELERYIDKKYGK